MFDLWPLLQSLFGEKVYLFVRDRLGPATTYIVRGTPRTHATTVCDEMITYVIRKKIKSVTVTVIFP